MWYSYIYKEGEFVEYNIYCDESCHLLTENNGNYMVIGGIYCPKGKVKQINRFIRMLKESCRIPRAEELKWNKISNANYEFYSRLITYFFTERDLKFRAMIVDKTILDFERYHNNENEFYHISYYYMLKYIITPGNSYNIYPDIKDTNSYYNHKIVRDFLRIKYNDVNGRTIQQVSPIRSYESEIIQITDILIGALAYHMRGLSGNRAKVKIVNQIKDSVPYGIDKTSGFDKTKFNIFVWESRK